MDSIKAKISEFIRKYSKVDNINEDENIFTMGFINSLFSMQLILFIEKEFDISVDNDVLGTEKFNTLNTICRYIQEKLNG
jgi:acyl carrier protein